MKLSEIIKILNADILVGHDLREMEVNTAFAADSISDVLTWAKPGCMLLTGLTHPQIIRTADILDIAAIIIVRGKKPSLETIRLAQEVNIPVLSTRYILFETAGRLYEKGIRACIEGVEIDLAYL